MLRVRYVMVSVLALAISSLPLPAVAAEKPDLPVGSRSIFFIDTSPSTDVRSLWTDGLRPSILKKLSQPFGAPRGKQEVFGKGRAPSDITVSLINANSRTSPFLKIVSAEDAELIWGTVWNMGGGARPSTGRLKELKDDFFGGTGAWTELSRSYLGDTPRVPTYAECKSKVLKAFDQGRFMDGTESKYRNQGVSALCRVVMRIAKSIVDADRLVVPSNCKGSCSDIVGAIRRAADLAKQSESDRQKTPFCLAIASDMVNDTPGVSHSSALNTLRVVNIASSTKQAEEKGGTAARDANVQFPLPTSLLVRVFVIAQGSSTQSGVPLDRMAYLDSYWTGFWRTARVEGQQVINSVNGACGG